MKTGKDLIRAVLFDLDGVLADTEPLKAKAWQVGLNEYGVGDGDKFYIPRIGRNGTEIAREAILEFYLATTPAALHKRVEKEIYPELARTETIPIRGNVAVARLLHGRGVALGVVSSQWMPILVNQLESLGIKDCFSVVISGEDFPGRGKPFPDVYLAAAEKLGVAPESCIAVEDTDTGIAAAKAAGMCCIGYRNSKSGRQDLSAADSAVRNITVGALKKCGLRLTLNKRRRK